MSLCDLEITETSLDTAGLPAGVPPLKAFYLYLTTGCNLCCRHCWVVSSYVNSRDDPGKVIDPKLLSKAVVEAKPLGLSSAKLTGGEPLFHPQFREIVSMLSARA